MDGDATPPPSRVPPWLDPALIRILSQQVEAGLACAAAPHALAQRLRDTAMAQRPALPLPLLEEAVAIALWVGGAQDAP